VYKVLLDNGGITQSQTVVFDDAPFVPPPALLPEKEGEQQFLRPPNPQESRQPKALSPLPAAVWHEENDSDDEDTGVPPELPPHGAEAEDATSPADMATQEQHEPAQHEVAALLGTASTMAPVDLKASCQSVPTKMLIRSTSLGCVVCMSNVPQTRKALVAKVEVCVVCLHAASIK
jgi:hypothetical protein